MKTIAYIFSIGIIFSISSLVAQAPAEKPKAPTSIEEINTKDFPYIWQYKDQVERCAPSIGGKSAIPREDAFKLLYHPLCISLGPILKDQKKREALQSKSLDLAVNAPGWFTSIDPRIQEQNDKAMALYNCAQIMEFYCSIPVIKEQIDNILAGKEESHEQKK